MRVIRPGLVLASLLLAAAPLQGQTLRGSPASVSRIYQQAVDHGLHFYETSDGVRRAVDRGRFVRLTDNADYGVHNVSHPYALETTRTFVERLGRQYRAACGERLVVTSAVRPRSLRLSNSTARSVHPTGMAIDLRKPRNARCLAWLRSTLLELDGRGVIEAVEESRPPHFHVAVFPNPYGRYVSGRGGALRTAQTPPPVAATATADGELVYRVRRGDSLWSIARRNGVSVEQVKRANGLRSSRIRAGQQLTIPAR